MWWSNIYPRSVKLSSAFKCRQICCIWLPGGGDTNMCNYTILWKAVLLLTQCDNPFHWFHSFFSRKKKKDKWKWNWNGSRSGARCENEKKFSSIFEKRESRWWLLQLQNLDQIFCSKSEQTLSFLTKPRLPNLQQIGTNTIIISNSYNINKFWVGIFTRQGHINKVC